MDWIKCSDRLPEVYCFVLVFADNQGTNEPKPISIARTNSHCFWEFLETNKRWSYGTYMDISYPIDNDDITHWMPIPDIPKDD